MLTHPLSLTIALLLVGGIISIQLYRRRAFLSPSLGALLLAIAAGGPTIRLHPATGVTVMVDNSASTRGASFRSRTFLRHRVTELLGNTPARWIRFADRAEPLAMHSDDALDDAASEQTVFTPSADQPVLLFSDGNFNLPAIAPAVYPVIDPLLSDAGDVAVEKLSANPAHVAATVRNTAGVGTLRWSGVIGATTENIPRGTTIHGRETNAAEIIARVDAHDRWPENDSLSILAQPPDVLERWWVSDAAGAAGWKMLGPADLPVDAKSYLAAGVVVLQNVAAGELDAVRQDALRSYVQNLGGGLLITGGDRAFGAGASAGNVLEELSPLSGYPPTPTTRWILLIDRSGSMAVDSRLKQAIAATTNLIPHLPHNDRISIGDFAGTLSWWIENAPVAAALSTLPPTDLNAGGPTNLQSALAQIAAQPANATATQVIVLSDGIASIDSPGALADRLNAHRVRINLLALASAEPAGAVVELISKTAGRIVRSEDQAHWASDLQTLAEASSKIGLNHFPAMLVYREINLPSRTVRDWNATWIKSGTIAMTQPGSPCAARWPFGIGAVGAIAFDPTQTETSTFEQLLAAPPRDPEIRVEWDEAASLGVHIDADGHNDLQLSLTLDRAPVLPIPIVAPGRYAITIDAPRSSAIAIVRNGSRIIERRAIAGHYPAEFQAIGNNIANLQRLAAQTGGQVIPPTLHSPIDFHWPVQERSLASIFAAAGAIVLAIAIRRI